MKVQAVTILILSAACFTGAVLLNGLWNRTSDNERKLCKLLQSRNIPHESCNRFDFVIPPEKRTP